MKFKEIKNIQKEDRVKRLKELRLEMIKARANSAKTGSAKKRGIKKMIAQILTLNTTENKLGVENKQ